MENFTHFHSFKFFSAEPKHSPPPSPRNYGSRTLKNAHLAEMQRFKEVEVRLWRLSRALDSAHHLAVGLILLG